MPRIEAAWTALTPTRGPRLVCEELVELAGTCSSDLISGTTTSAGAGTTSATTAAGTEGATSSVVQAVLSTARGASASPALMRLEMVVMDQGFLNVRRPTRPVFDRHTGAAERHW